MTAQLPAFEARSASSQLVESWRTFCRAIRRHKSLKGKSHKDEAGLVDGGGVDADAVLVAERARDVVRRVGLAADDKHEATAARARKCRAVHMPAWASHAAKWSRCAHDSGRERKQGTYHNGTKCAVFQ
eukprot:1972257-Pleurochrysis_carterae.AAC.1